MAFLPNIPQSTDQLSVSQVNILNNFTILGAIAGNASTGGTPINATAGFNFVDFANQGGAIPSTSTDNYLFSGTYSVTGNPELTISYQNGKDYPLTASLLSNNATPAAQTSGWSYLPSGLIIKWGNGTTSAGAYTYTMPTGANIPVFTQALFANAWVWETSASDTNHFVRLVNYTNTQLSLWGSQRTTTTTAAVGFNWIAIGY